MSSAPFWYMGCSLCYKSLCASTAGGSYDCRYCSTPNVTALPRARADICIEDETGKLAASLMGKVAEDYLQCSAFKLMGISKGKLSDEGNVRLNIDDQYIFYVKKLPAAQSPSDGGKTPVTFSENLTHKFEVISLEEYMRNKFKGAHSEASVGHSSTTSALGDSNTSIIRSTSSPLAKRTLFPTNTASSSTKKKLNDKLD